jgi:hypothetical protein
MSAILNTPQIEWQTETPALQRVENVMLVLQRVEKFESVGTPSVRSLGASIVDEFAQDLRRLADA